MSLRVRKEGVAQVDITCRDGATGAVPCRSERPSSHDITRTEPIPSPPTFVTFTANIYYRSLALGARLSKYT